MSRFFLLTSPSRKSWKDRNTVEGYLEPDHRFNPLGLVLSLLFRRKLAAVTVVTLVGFFIFLLLGAQGLKALGECSNIYTPFLRQ